MNQYLDGIGHVGIPTGDLEKTKEFYAKLGFSPIYDAYLEEKDQHVSFLKLGNLVIEAYEDTAAQRDGAIDHIALACSDIENAYEEARRMNLILLTDGIQKLPFWENGIGYFIIQGPNRERIEFCQQF